MKLKMRQFLALAWALLMVLASHAGDVFFPHLWNSYFSMSFADYREGANLSDAGARGGSWGSSVIPAGCSAKIGIVDGEKTLTVDVDDDAWLAFTPRVENLKSTRACLFRGKFTMMEAVPPLSPTASGAFTVAATNGVDVKFMAYDPSQAQWLSMLPETSVIPAQFDIWYDFSFRYGKVDGVECVSYYLKTPSGEYELLRAEGSGASAFPVPVAADPHATRVLINGVGDVGDFSGACQQGGAITIR